MKNLFLSTIAIVLALSIFPAEAQNTINHEKNNYVVLTKTLPQLQPIFLTAEALAKEDGEKFGDFQVVIYGKTVQELTDKKAMKKIIMRAKNANIKLKVCNMALKTFDVDPGKIPDEFEIVDNAFTHILQMQKQGYLSIQL